MSTKEYWIIKKHTANSGDKTIFVGPIDLVEESILALTAENGKLFSDCRFGPYKHSFSIVGRCETLRLSDGSKRDLYSVEEFKGDLWTKDPGKRWQFNARAYPDSKPRSRKRKK